MKHSFIVTVYFFFSHLWTDVGYEIRLGENYSTYKNNFNATKTILKDFVVS